MSGIDHQIAQEVLTTCRAGAPETSAALSRALDQPIELADSQIGQWNPAEPPADLGQPGLAIVLGVGDSAAIYAIPASTGLLPAWVARPDATGTSKLTTLAQELGMLLLPEQFMPESFHAQYVGRLDEALRRGQVPDDAAILTLTLSGGGAAHPTYLIWPAPGREAVLLDPAIPGEDDHAQPSTGATAAAAEAHGEPPLANQHDVDFDVLPLYARSLLRISVPIMVTLARKRQRVGSIVELAPGAIIQFDKSCEELLELEISGRPAALGECVKVGDKFGLRITSMILPEEGFRPIGTPRAPAANLAAR